MALIIKFKSGPQSGKENVFDLDEISLGRDPSCNIVFDEIEVSRHHARIYKSNNEYFIEDLNSTNGTYINGQPVKKQEIIQNGDLITLGDSVVLEFSTDDPLLSRPFHGISRKKSVYAVNEVITKPAENQRISSLSDATSSEVGSAGEKWINRFPSWLIILVIALAFLVFFCFIPFIIIEATNQWCNLFSGFFNAISPGACP